MRATVWPVFQRYWFDALVICAAVAGAVEFVVQQDEADAPTTPLAVAVVVEVGLTLVLLARRRFPFGAPAAMFVGAAAISFWDGRLVNFTLASFLTAVAACFLLGLLEERRQALIGLAIAVAGVFIVFWNDPGRLSSDLVFTPIFFTVVWLFAFGLAGIRAVASGDALLAPSITKRVIEEFVSRPPATVKTAPPELEELTEREAEVLKQMARGLSNAEIAKEPSSVRRPSRRTSHGCSRSWAFGTAFRRSCSHTRPASSIADPL